VLGTSSRSNSSRAARSKTKPGTPPIARKKVLSHTSLSKGRLKVVSGVGQAPAAPGLSETERMQQREKELTKELDDKTAQFLAMQAQLAKLESKLSEMQKTIELQNRMLAAMQKPSTPPQKPANGWKDYWPAGPGILIAGMIYFFANRSRKRTLENWEPTQRGSNSGKARNPF
jgi:TolA-binding protein